ncbi:uncharacterized protein LOC119681560 isoform X2 [Teleopsis dalmanni]|uniref:uncharacterized protein LOC119681560 isoform X2 n=1 Tax=Teleopsis dalmanni TaxID=139649 RepID=UPI0018CF75A6|nr:uncharacterized protein LOC119681560 isoform X2 [Teleopsis dalmanni]
MEVVKLYIIFMAVAFKYSLATLSEMEQPSVACPDLFKYVTDANEAYGIITIPTQDITDKRVHLTVTVNQRDTKNLIYNLLPVESIDNSIRKIYENKPIEFRLIFASPTEYPKITKITVNENTVCSDVGYPAPSITTVLQLILGSLISSSRDLSLQKLHNCFNYFRYEEQNNKTIGKIKIPHYLFHDGKFEVSVSVSQKPPIQYNVFGLSPYKTLDETILDHLEGKPSYYRFDFPGQTEIPLLKYIKVNGKIICTTNNGNVRSNRIWYSATHSQHFTGGFGNLNTDDEDDDDDSEESKDKRTCGRENDVLIPIVRFNDTTGQFPWLAAIYLKRNDTLKFICSGSLISARTVISAAYCFDTESVMADQMIVKLGGGIKATDSQIFNFGVEKIIIHPNYTSALIADANIALLHLTSSFFQLY